MNKIKHSRSQSIIDFAEEYARLAHEEVNHIRKYTGEPYIVHPTEVAEIVASVTDSFQMICAAYLHDVVEDTNRTLEEIDNAGFKWPITSLVHGMTDISIASDGNRATRKGIDRDHMARQDHRVHTIKLADMISNSPPILEHDPKFAKIYMAEKKQLLEVLQDGNPILLERATKIVEEYYNA